MGRTAPATNANNAYGAQSGTAYTNASNDIGQYNANEAELASGKNVGANPFQSSSYLSNVNKEQSESLNNAATSGQAALRRGTIASGGLNGSQSILGQKSIALQTGQLADTLSAQRAASDYKSNLAYQQYLAGAPLNAAGAEASLYGTATGGQGNALNNLTSLSGQQYGFYGGMIDSALAGAGTGAGLAACPVEGSLFLMADQSERPVETLRVGDAIAGIDGDPQTIEEIQPAYVDALRIKTENGCEFKNSTTHAYILPRGGFTIAFKCLGRIIHTRLGPSRIVSVESIGRQRVFNIMTNGSHTYCADGAWALGEEMFDPLNGMNEWSAVGTGAA
jgi:hypothetical protein